MMLAVEPTNVYIAIPGAVAIAVATALGLWLRSRSSKKNDSWTPPR